jgi:hypothetical protein
MDGSEFATDLAERIVAAQRAFDDAEREQDYYAMDVRSGELKSLHRLATENGVIMPTVAADHEATEA